MKLCQQNWCVNILPGKSMWSSFNFKPRIFSSLSWLSFQGWSILNQKLGFKRCLLFDRKRRPSHCTYAKVYVQLFPSLVLNKPFLQAAHIAAANGSISILDFLLKQVQRIPYFQFALFRLFEMFTKIVKHGFPWLCPEYLPNQYTR